MPDNSTEALTRAAFHILLALSGTDLHGLGIASEIERATDGDVELGPGTLYRSLKELVEARLIREVEAPRAADDPRRKYYRITAAGRTRVSEEAERMERVVRLARERRLLPRRA